MALKSEKLRHVRQGLVAAFIVVALGLLLTQCPANRDGTPGQLAQAMEETVTAARSGALALDLRIRDRSTAQLASVQITDARDEAVKAYQGIADLKASDPADVARKQLLTGSMTGIIDQLNLASAHVHGVVTEPTLDSLRAELLASADALETGYR